VECSRWGPSDLPSVCIESHNASCDVCFVDFKAPLPRTSDSPAPQPKMPKSKDRSEPKPLRQLPCQHVLHVCYFFYIDIPYIYLYLFSSIPVFKNSSYTDRIDVQPVASPSVKTQTYLKTYLNTHIDNDMHVIPVVAFVFVLDGSPSHLPLRNLNSPERFQAST
jgi:hypothetical protein